MKQIAVILWTSDGYDGASWEDDVEISNKDYRRIINLAKKYEFDPSETYEFGFENYDVFEYESFTEYLSENAPEVDKRLEKKTRKPIEESFEGFNNEETNLDYDIDNYSTGYYINLEWLVKVLKKQQ